MPDLALLGHLLREAVSRSRPERIPEPELLMDEAAQVAAFARAGRENGPIAQIYLLHSLQLCGLIAPGDHVLDLACGPANQLGQIARLNPDAHFTGIDLAPRMLDDARTTLRLQGVTNVVLHQDDMTRLERIPDASQDLVMSTFSLHHLPNEAALGQCFRAIRRVLKPGGRVFLSDFGALRRESTRHFMAHRFAAEQGELFTRDYHHSLCAAFPVATLRTALPALGPGVRLIASPLAPFMVFLRSPAKHRLSVSTRSSLNAIYSALPQVQRRDLDELRMCFRLRALFIPSTRR
jgi:arsenite methyltransferase